MRMGEGVEWGVHCAVVLAGLPVGATLTGRALAEFHGVSESYLVKHLQAMATAGLLESVPGPRGGYRLSRPPEHITLLDVVEAIEGAEPPFRCTEIRRRGPAALEPAAYALPCKVHVAMMRAEGAWRQSLQATTIAGLLREVNATVDPRVTARTGAWVRQRLRR